MPQMPDLSDPRNQRRLLIAVPLVLFLLGGIAGLALRSDGGGPSTVSTDSSTTTSTTSATSTTTSSTTSTTRPPATTTTVAPSTTTAAGPTVTLTGSPLSIACAAAGVSTTTVPPTVTLTWTSQRASSVDISVDGPGVYSSHGPSGSTSINVPCDGKTHTYTATARGASGQTAQATVTVTTMT